MDGQILSATADTTTVRPTRLAQHQEADHRVSNSLQLVTALLSLQARETADARVQEALTAAARRVAAVGAIHRQLYRSDGGKAIDIAAYLHELGAGLEEGLGSGPGRKRIRIHAETADVHPSFATVLGILLSELVMNACKHAYAHDEPGEIDVCLFFRATSGFLLEVRDYGGRGDAEIPSGQAPGLGTHLIQVMSRRLGATYAYVRDNEGMRFTLRGLVEPALA